MKKTEQFILIITAAVLSAVSHFIFSAFGFNPTDDGFILAFSRRIIEGQMPHLDFISIRPVLSPLIHLPVVYLSDESAFMTSRLIVWFQFGLIAWCWTNIIDRFTGSSSGLPDKIIFLILIFIFSVHHFPVTAWHTTDGLMLVSIGLFMAVSGGSSMKIAGYLIIGMSYLCKQNFLIAAPLVMIILDDWRDKKIIAAFLLPGFIYLLFLVISGAFNDAAVQFLSQSSFIRPAFIRYINLYSAAGAAAGIALYILYKKYFAYNNSPAVSTGLKSVITLIIILLIVTSLLLMHTDVLFLDFTYTLFAITAALTAMMIYNVRNRKDDLITLYLLIIAIAWVSSISLGVNYPVFLSGQLIICIYLLFKTSASVNQIFFWEKGFVKSTAIVIVIFILFGSVRYNNIYRDMTADKLTYDLAGVLPGGKGIFTNENTYKVMSDLKAAVEQAESITETFTIIPDYAAYWVKSKQVNPLPADWMQRTELKSSELLSRIENKLNELRLSNTVILQKTESRTLAEGIFPIELTDYYATARYVSESFTKIGETKYFELYR